MKRVKIMSNKKQDRIRIRRFWTMNPRDRIHGEGKKLDSYDRNAEKRDWKKEI
jgi:hypothetical protein